MDNGEIPSEQFDRQTDATESMTFPQLLWWPITITGRLQVDAHFLVRDFLRVQYSRVAIENILAAMST